MKVSLKEGTKKISAISKKLDQDVDIALGAEVLAQNGAEQGESADPVLPAEFGDRIVRDLNLRHR